MKWFLILAGLFVMTQLSVAQLPAQEENVLDWDIDSIFDAPLEEEPSEEIKTAAGGDTIKKLIKQRGFTFDASFEFLAGIAPGWREAPWLTAEDYGFHLDRYIKLRSTLGMDAQISEFFRVKSVVFFEIPIFSFSLGDFFFDYNIFNVVFFRGGKYNHSWGISPNFGFTNLLSRVPKNSSAGDSFILKADVPAGIGGFQVLALTRADLMTSAPLLTKEDFAYGGKYNLALRWADLDMGIFYQEGMALRTFLSVKTTVLKTELYSEGLIAIDVHEPSNVSGAVNIGFARDFFGDRFNVNGEIFYNAEKDVYWYRPESNIREAGTSPFIEGINGALNLQYRFGGKADPRIFTQVLYAPMENSARLIPGFRISPWSHLEIYLALPMALGGRDGYYYNNTPTVDTLNNPIPFCLMLIFSLSGSIQAGYYY